MKKIGEILITNGLIESSILQRALVKQRETGLRLCSLLVQDGALDPDEAACALGEQHGVAAALQRHLKGRDRSLPEFLSAAIARACVALPIGRMGSGEIIVVVRDPSPALATQLARAMKERIRLAVAPSHQLEELVLETYGPDENDFDVDLSTGPIMSLELDEDQIEAMSDDSMTDLGSLELVDLDDTGVSKDATQHQVPIGKQRATTLPPANVSVDSPSYRSSSPIIVDAPSQRPSGPIVVDSPSQRFAPGRAALAAAGPPAPRTSTPPGGALDAAAGIAVGRTQTPPRSSLDAAAASVVDGPSHRASSPIVVDAPSQRFAPGRAALAAADGAHDAAAGIAVARTQTPREGRHAPAQMLRDQEAVARATLDLASLELDLEVPAPSEPERTQPAARESSPEPQPPTPGTLEPGPSPPAARAVIRPIGKPAITIPPLTRMPTPAMGLPIPTVPPAAARSLGTPVISIPPIASSPPIAPPRLDPSRPPPAALAALQRASSNASRTTPVPGIPKAPVATAAPPPAIAVGTESQGAPVPDEIALGTQLPTASLAISGRLADALTALTAASTMDAACDALFAFAAKRWSAVLLLDIEDATATGRRGHGAQLSDDLAQWIVISLEEPSLLHNAFTTAGVSTLTPSGHGDAEDRVQKLLGMARAPSAIAIAVDGNPGHLLAVGDPDGDDLKTAAADLERLARAAGDTFTRLRGR